MNEAATLLTALLGEPLVYSTLLLILIGLIPERALAKLPLAGPAISLLKVWLEAQRTQAVSRRELAAQILADGAVGGLEQLKRRGVVDSATARALAVQHVTKHARLDPDTALRLVERSVSEITPRIEAIQGALISAPCACHTCVNHAPTGPVA